MKIKRFVRQRLFSICFSLWVATQASAAPLPDIEAHQFQSTPVRMSKSGRVYLFQSPPNDLPKTGNLVLIHEHNKPAMAFRVLQTNPEKSQYVAKRVRRYDQIGELKLNDQYFSIEKVSDLLAQPAPDLQPEPAPAATPFPVMTPVPAASGISPSPSSPEAVDEELDQEPTQRKAKKPKKEETNLEIYDYDDDLDGGTSPQNLKKDRETNVDRAPHDDEEYDDSASAFEIEETPRLEPFKNMISINAGMYKNMSAFRFAGGTHNGFNIAYARTLKNDVFILAKVPQDSISLEFGVGYYSWLNANNNQLFKVAPIYGELHYNLAFSQTFSLYLYAGLQYNGVFSTSNVNSSNSSDSETIRNLQGIQVNAGVGFLYNMGPQWYLRFNLGWDRITAGIGLKW